MYLKDLIALLRSVPSDTVVHYGFRNPHSYRGFYERLAFEPGRNTTVGAMAMLAEESLGKTFEGYKGGDFEMNEYTECHLANYSECGEELTTPMVRLMLGLDPWHYEDSPYGKKPDA